MGRPRTLVLAAATAVAAAALPLAAAEAATVTVNGVVTSVSGEVQSGSVQVFKRVDDRTGDGIDDYDFVTSAPLASGGAFTVAAEEDQYLLHLTVNTRSPDGVFTSFSFQEGAGFIEGEPVNVTVPATEVTVHLENGAGGAATAEVRLQCEEEADGFQNIASDSSTTGTGSVQLWMMGGPSCFLEAAFDGITKRQPFVEGEETSDQTMVLVSHLLSGRLEVPVGPAQNVRVFAHDGTSDVASVEVPAGQETYQLRVPPGELTIYAVADAYPSHTFNASAAVDVQSDQTLDFVVPSTPVSVAVRDASGPTEQLVTLLCFTPDQLALRTEGTGSAVELRGLPSVDPVSCMLTVRDPDSFEQLLSKPVQVVAGGPNNLTAHLDSDEVTYAADADGVDDALEAQGPNDGDGNSDSVQDAEQGNVATLPRSGGAPDPQADTWVTLAGPAGSELEAVTTSDAGALPPPPAGVTLPAGLVSFRLTGITSGSTQTVDIHTPGTAAVLDYAKYHGGAWSLLPRDRVAGSAGLTSITLTDGGVGDADGEANGVIVDPGGIAQITSSYRFDGFLAPVNDPRLMPSAPMSVFKRNSTVPVSFVLRDSSGQVATPGSPPVWMTPVRLTSTSAGVNEQVLTAPETEDGEFTLNGDRWRYNWSTKGLAAGFTYKIGARLDDGSTHYVTVAVR